MAWHVGKAQFYELVEQALSGLPEQFAQFLEEVPVEVRSRSTAKERRDAGLKGNSLLLGLYKGQPLTSRRVEDSGVLPDVIYIFQEDVELACDSEQELIEQVRITVLHEIGHLFGLNEDDLEALGYR